MLLFLIQTGLSSPIKNAQVYSFTASHPKIEESDNTVHIRWPFCTTYPNEVRCPKKLWVNIEIDVNAYVERRNAAHDSLHEIMKTSYTDMKPLATALNQYFGRAGIKDMATKVGVVQGMIKAIHYAYDDCSGRKKADCNNQDATGWTEYPKYALEFIFDEKGDCDDAMIASTSILENLNVESWLVLWNTHASTAVTREQGNLESVRLPKNSRYIQPPKGGAPLLSVDSVGSMNGCTYGCTPLGWNEWEQDGLIIEGVYRYNNPVIDTLGLKAWKGNGLFQYTPEDRRKEERPKILKEIKKKKIKWEENNTKRLKKLNVDEEKISEITKKATPYRESNAEGWGVITFVLGILTGALLLRWYQRRKKRQELVEYYKEVDEKNRF